MFAVIKKVFNVLGEKWSVAEIEAETLRDEFEVGAQQDCPGNRKSCPRWTPMASEWQWNIFFYADNLHAATQRSHGAQILAGQNMIRVSSKRNFWFGLLIWTHAAFALRKHSSGLRRALYLNIFKMASCKKNGENMIWNQFWRSSAEYGDVPFLRHTKKWQILKWRDDWCLMRVDWRNHMGY